MQAPDLTTHETPAAFRSRVDSVFAQLQAPADEPAWSLSREQIFRSGKDRAYSSDEEEEAVEEDQKRRELLPGSLIDFEGDEEQLGTASAAFSKGLDKEDDFDLTDHLALASGVPDARPRPHTEVLEGNAYDERMQTTRGGTSALHPAPNTSAQDNKRTRDGQSAAAAAAAAAAAVTAAGPRSGQSGLQPRQHDRQACVPDHVKNPHKYTCYTLDEPLVVGSGGGGDSSRPAATPSREVEHREAADTAEQPAEAAPGSVAFRAKPRAAGDHEPERMQTDAMEALEAANTAQASARTGLRAAPASAQDDAEGEEGGMQVSPGEAIAMPGETSRRPARSARRGRQRVEVDNDSD